MAPNLGGSGDASTSIIESRCIKKHKCNLDKLRSIQINLDKNYISCKLDNNRMNCRYNIHKIQIEFTHVPVQIRENLDQL